MPALREPSTITLYTSRKPASTWFLLGILAGLWAGYFLTRSL